MHKDRHTLIIGYGNPGRQDDGLGEVFIQKIRQQEQLHKLVTPVSYQTDYQLSVETAYDLQEYERVIFIDASYEAPAPFLFEKIQGHKNSSLSSHSVSPEALLELCKTLYQHEPTGFLLALRGYEFDRFEEKLSQQATTNCDQAVSFLTNWLTENSHTSETTSHA